MSVLIRVPPGEGLSPDEARTVAEAAKSCRIVAFPTDTVYGLGSTALIKAASRKIYQIKQRSSLKPLPVLVKSAEAAKPWVWWTQAAELLARKFWPGAMTLVLKPTKDGRLLTFAEYPTLAVRVPNHPVALQLLEASDIPWVATSANLSGSQALKDGAAVAEKFQGLADFIIDAGPAPGTESTVVDATRLPVRILREGAIPAAEILEATRQAV